ncbi:MAG: hypothetical protein HFH92_01875 [Lachnospiraceae bacterium]|uniref:hypothetical protein n=1 Tax=uncultured Acetatifactor sp. TaxID=1671927 RepID=UPI002631B97A|nr:hypothetical protein [uncultured Acetatifactor sp.]MCI8787856.1 hypothetical protein [Lachnospiraceae bacterium]
MGSAEKEGRNEVEESNTTEERNEAFPGPEGEGGSPVGRHGEMERGMAEPFPFLEFLDENSDFLHAADIGGAKPVPLSGLLALRAHVDIFCGVFDTFG